VVILGTEISLVANVKQSFRLYWYLWLILLVTVCFDFVTTVLFMQRDGIHTEGNAVVRNLAYTLGVFPGVAIAKFLQIIAAIGFSALAPSLARATLLLILLLNLVAIIKNLM